MPQLREELNQPRYWSPPSRYTSAGNRSVSPRVSKTATQLEPESNQTSNMSVSFRKSPPLHFGQVNPSDSNSLSGRAYQASAVSTAKISATWSIIFVSAIASSHDWQ